jgi:hypothetical protein
LPSSGSEVIQDRCKGIGKILPDNAVILYEEDEENLGWKTWMGVIFLILALTLIRLVYRVLERVSLLRSREALARKLNYLGGYEESAAEAPGHV